MLVLPKASMRAMTSDATALGHDPDITEMFPEPEAVELDPNGRRFRWQWVALLPQIDTDAVLNKVPVTRNKWSERAATRRNGHGQALYAPCAPRGPPLGARGSGEPYRARGRLAAPRRGARHPRHGLQPQAAAGRQRDPVRLRPAPPSAQPRGWIPRSARSVRRARRHGAALALSRAPDSLADSYTIS
jgi:hypothetical protein